MTEAPSEVYDLGYQHYDGPREGRMRARKAVLFNGVRASLGLGRSARHKILPILLFVSVMVPAVVLALIATVTERLPVEESIPGHADYYQVVSIIVIIFAAIVAPELLCADRSDGVISLYLVRPLTSNDYVGARWLAFFLITLAIVYAGQVVLLVGLILAASEPVQYLRENWLDVPRFIGAGFLLAIFTTTIPLAVAAFTRRRAYAAAFVIGLYIISAVVAGILTECEDESGDPGCRPLAGDTARWFGLVDIGRVPIHVSDMIFAKDNESRLSREVSRLPDAVPVLWYAALVAGPGLLLWWRYRRLTV